MYSENPEYDASKRPIILDPQTGKFKKSTNDIIKVDESILIAYISEKNVLSYSNIYSKDRLSLDLRSFKCVCGSLSKSLSTVFDMNNVECRAPDSANSVQSISNRIFREMIRTPDSSFYTHLVFETNEIFTWFMNVREVHLYSFIARKIGESNICNVLYTVSWNQKSELPVNQDENIDPGTYTLTKNPCSHRHISSEHYEYQHQYNSLYYQTGKGSFIKPESGNILVPIYLTLPNTRKSFLGVLATDTDLNKAPQWKIIKEGNCGITENYIKDYWEKKFDLIVKNGVHGYLCLPEGKFDKTNSTFFFYSKDGTREVPISRFFLKIVVKSDYSQGQVFVSINSRYFSTRDKIFEVLTVCTFHKTWVQPSKNTPT